MVGRVVAAEMDIRRCICDTASELKLAFLNMHVYYTNGNLSVS